MFQKFFTHVKEKVVFTAGKQELIKTYFIPKKLRKQQHKLHKGELCKYFICVVNGLLRSYDLDDEG